MAYNGPFKNLVNDEKWQKGKLINFYPLNGAESFGYNPMDHSGPEQDLFNQVLVIPIKSFLQNGSNIQISQNHR